jgi:hypothetical protein
VQWGEKQTQRGARAGPSCIVVWCPEQRGASQDETVETSIDRYTQCHVKTPDGLMTCRRPWAQQVSLLLHQVAHLGSFMVPHLHTHHTNEAMNLESAEGTESVIYMVSLHSVRTILCIALLHFRPYPLSL